MGLSIFRYLLYFHHGDAVTIKLFIFKEVSYMIIFGLTFVGTVSFASGFIAGIFASAAALSKFCALLVFAFVALAIGTRSRLAWTAMFLVVLVMVALDVLAPYSAVIAKVLAFIVACVVTYFIKNPILRYVRHDQRSDNPRLSPIIRTVLRII